MIDDQDKEPDKWERTLADLTDTPEPISEPLGEAFLEDFLGWHSTRDGRFAQEDIDEFVEERTIIGRTSPRGREKIRTYLMKRLLDTDVAVVDMLMAKAENLSEAEHARRLHEAQESEAGVLHGYAHRFHIDAANGHEQVNRLKREGAISGRDYSTSIQRAEQEAIMASHAANEATCAASQIDGQIAAQRAYAASTAALQNSATGQGILAAQQHREAALWHEKAVVPKELDEDEIVRLARKASAEATAASESTYSGQRNEALHHLGLAQRALRSAVEQVLSAQDDIQQGWPDLPGIQTDQKALARILEERFPWLGTKIAEKPEGLVVIENLHGLHAELEGEQVKVPPVHKKGDTLAPELEEGLAEVIKDWRAQWTIEDWVRFLGEQLGNDRVNTLIIEHDEEREAEESE